MKTLGVVFVAGITSIFIAGCGEKLLDFRNAEIVNGKLYSEGANAPFTGKVTNVPDTKLLNSQAGTPVFVRIIRENSSGGTTYIDNLFSPGLCDLNFKEGLPDGDAICKQPRSDIVKYKMKFKDGALNGTSQVYDLSSDKKVTAEVEFVDGKVDGKFETWNPATKNTIIKTHYKNNLVHGKVEKYSEQAGKLIYEGNAVDGLIDGEATQYSPDGRFPIGRSHYVRGVLDGVNESFSPETGKITGHDEWKNGKRNGPAKQWNANGDLISDVILEDDVIVKVNLSPKPATAEAINACADQWVAAYRKENGVDAMINSDQSQEWETWCKEGKYPPKM